MFSWEYNDIKSLDPSFVTHDLVVQKDTKPIQQKRRPMHLKHYLLVKKEIDKYHKVGFIELIDYSPWMANIVPKLKPNRKIICYIYFRYLNKAFPKDNFPLPHINIIVDSNIGHELLSFMNGF